MSARATQRWGAYGFLVPYLVLFAGFLLLPLIFGFCLGFYRWEMLSPAPPQFAGLANYKEAIKDEYFWRALQATFWFVILDVPSTVVLALLLALGVNALPDRRQSIYRAAFVLPTMMSVSVVGILWRWFYSNDFGLFNSWLARVGITVPWISDPRWAMPSIVLMTLWWTSGGSMLILLAGLQQIPPHYYEAAQIDGANRWVQFWHITLPLLRPVLLFVIITGVIGAFQVFGQTFMVTQGGPELSTRVMVQYIYETAFNHYRMGYGAAMSWLLFVVILLFGMLQFWLAREKK